MTERYSTCVHYDKNIGCEKGIFSCKFCCLYEVYAKITYKTEVQE